jgi:uncharacterized protein YigA (DUF484 family)
MIDTATLEQRLVVLEAEVTALKQQAKANPTAANWLERLVGSISDDEGFEQVLEYGRAFRNHDRPSDQDDAST